MSKRTIATSIAGLFAKAAKLLDEPQLSSSLCLIFNGMASMIAIVFLILFFREYAGSLLWLGVAGCICMILANTTDLFPHWLNKADGKSAARKKHKENIILIFLKQFSNISQTT